MTNQNNAAQPVLTDDDIEALAKKHIAPHADRLDAIMLNPVPYQQTEQFRRVKAMIGDALSKLRAPVADGTDELSLEAQEHGNRRYEQGFATGWDQCMASAPVAGEAPPVAWEDVRDALAMFLSGATGKASKHWIEPLEDATASGPLAKMRACLAAPQASTVARVATEELAKLAEDLGDLASDMAYEANQEMDQEKASRAALIERGERALRGFVDAAPLASEAVLPAPVHDLRYHDQYRVGWNRCLDACRAALAAQPGDAKP